MNILIIDAASDKIVLTIIKNKIFHISNHKNNKINYDKLIIFIKNILKKNKLSLKKINRIYVNRGPGSYSGIRNSLSVAKGFYLIKGIDYYCFSFLDFIRLNDYLRKKIKNNPYLLKKYHNIEYQDIPVLCEKFNIKKNLIKPLYLG